MSSYLLNRNGNYHVRIRIPSDLAATIPGTELVKSLKTRDAKAARLAALPFHQNIFRTFTLLRSGFISREQALDFIDSAMNRSRRAFLATPLVNAPAPNLEPSKCDSSQFSPSGEQPGLSRGQSPLLSEVVKQYLNDRQHGWGAKTKMENEGSYTLILDIIGDIEVTVVDRLLVRSLRDKLMKLPANLYKHYPNQSAREVLEYIEGNPKAGVTAMSITTVNKHISRLSSIMKHCIKEGHLSSNPASGLKVKQKRRPDEERKAYSMADLMSVTTCLPVNEDKPERYWIPLIGMLSGLRLDEACQLYTEDLEEVDGVWCFNINDDKDKKVKTLSSKRLVPVHPQLVRMGFLAYVASMKEKGQPRLWMNLQWRKEDGYSNAFGKWFQRFNRQHVTTDPLKTFHSFRHTFADALKQQGEQDAVISELMGHANGSITMGRYGKRYRPQVLLEAVCKLGYSSTLFVTA